MKATTAYVESKFREFNHLCFDGQLPMLPVHLSRARTFLGRIAYRSRRMPGGKWRNCDYALRINTLFDMTQEQLDDVILHEMIHYYILYNELPDDAPHGTRFTAMMNDLNRRFGRHITVSHRLTADERKQDQRVRQHLVCRVQLASGRIGLLVACKSRLFQLWDTLEASTQVKQAQWYSSLHPFFNNYHRTTTAKIYTVDETKLADALADASPLVRHGNTISLSSPPR